ncbi:MAG: ATP-binding protein [bacterium]
MITEIFNLQNLWRNNRDFALELKKRSALQALNENLDNQKILGLIGSRQVGKSSLIYLMIKHLISTQSVTVEQIFYFNLDDLKLRELFENMAEFVQFIRPGAEKKFIFIDEIQRLDNPGLFLKELYDLNLNLKIVYSGSSQLEIKSKMKENLVGRARQFEIQRLSFAEYLQFNEPITRQQALEEMLIFGAYPEVVLERHRTEKKLLIKDIFQSYVEKDLIDFLKIDNINAFNKLLVLLANQIGALLNIENLAKSIKIHRNEVEKYITVLERTFIIRRIYPFFENYKKEITKTPKVYFLDLGLRNFILNNFNPPEMRNDIGALFENFFLIELIHDDFFSFNKINYWRTTNQIEIDFIVTRADGREASEVKWSKTTPPKSFKTITRYYPEMKTRLVTKKDFGV